MLKSQLLASRGVPSCSGGPRFVNSIVGPARQRLVAARASSARSFDSDEDLDSDLASELGRMDPSKAEKMAKHFELVWKITKSRGATRCDCCRGTAEQECGWCHGTGVMTVGDTIFPRSQSGSECPVCKGTGYVKCEHCRGTGFRAPWLGMNPKIES